MRRAARAAVVAGALAAAACATLARPTEADVAWLAAQGRPTTLDDLARGRAAYVRTCGGCHALHRPEQFAPEKWPGLLDDMAREHDVKIAPAERPYIEAFLMAASARAHGHPGRTRA